MAEDTYNHLDWAADIMESKGTLTGRFQPMSWLQIRGVVHEFNAASNPSEKRYHLMVVEAMIRNHWREQIKKQKEADRLRRWNEKGQH